MKRRAVFLGASAALALTVAALAAAGAGKRGSIPAALGGDTSRALDGDTAFSFPAANLREENQRVFFFGNRLFNTNWVAAPGSVKSFDGLGPLFNRVSCSGCHTRDGRGRPPLAPGETMESMLLRLSVPDAAAQNGASPHPVYGDQLSERAIGGIAPEGRTRIGRKRVTGEYGDGEPFELEAPEYSIDEPGYGPLGDGLMISPRVAPQVIGLGLLEAVPEAGILEVADPDDVDNDGISGRPNRVFDPSVGETRIGRFGWKANQAGLMAQNAGAALGDIGLTMPYATDENCSPAQTACLASPRGDGIDLSADFLARLTDYTRLLAVPARRGANEPAVQAGEELFGAIGCAQCHRERMRAGDAALPELAGQTFFPFTDLLLHDMGEALADNRPDGLATGSEWRTPPLWGLGLVPQVNGHDRLLHDGRARGFAEAILWHGGEAERARERFRNLEKREREALIAFLGSL
jgi:CxxC motif-containing protein (DUF1111 family)